MAMNLMQILMLVFAPSLYIVLACCAFAQFGLIFNAISSLAFHMQRQPALEALTPLLKAFVKYLESIFGCPNTPFGLCPLAGQRTSLCPILPMCCW
ncbi:hypothetical protein COO60DRAFT_445799 [Scenedesmus sp. NREL 46B-D3]|nr:hypothetical protein COO60DRAFT_445799 [Scenedesmus sp. NREL 46B-D3]